MHTTSSPSLHKQTGYGITSTSIPLFLNAITLIGYSASFFYYKVLIYKYPTPLLK